MPSTINSSIRRSARRRPPTGLPVSRSSAPDASRPLATWQKDLAGRYIAASANFCRFFQLATGALPLGYRDGDLFPELQASRRAEAEHKALSCGEAQFIVEEHAGYRRELIIAPLYGAAGKPCGIHGIARDSDTQPGEAGHDERSRLRRSHELLRKLAIRRQQEHEDVRRDITHRMHEELAQDVSAMRLHLTVLARDLATPGNPVLGTMDEITGRCIARIRDMVKTLRPRALDLGIVPALRWLADDFYRGLELEFRLDLPEQLEVNDQAATFLFRAAQEALLNVALHAAATRIGIQLEKSRGWIRLRIDDNGGGFDTTQPPPEGAVGLVGMAEQALHLDGQVRVCSIPQGGTTVEIVVPVRAARKKRA